MSTKKIIIKFDQVADQPCEAIRRLVGFVQAKYLIDLIDVADLNANPRSAKVGSVTEDIIDSITKTKEIFPFKTKGILLAVSTPPRELERKRFEFEFSDSVSEGILDGGHNTLAIALHILNVATEGDRSIQKIKRWSDLKDVWFRYKDQVADVRDQLDFLVPLEVLLPLNEEETTQAIFRSAILDICAARNNNVQLLADAKANQAGHYDEIKRALDPDLAKDIVWKTNETGRVPVRDIVALSWVALSMLPALEKYRVSPNQIYSSKGKCMQNFVDLMEDESVSEQVDGVYKLKDKQVLSAFKLLKDFPKLYDAIYKRFPEAYNKADGSFGRIVSVKLFKPEKYLDDKKKYLKHQPHTPFYEEAVNYNYPEGFIMPLVFGLSALIRADKEGLSWKVDPFKFLADHFDKIVENYKGVLQLSEWDPQKVGKNAMSYGIACQQFEHYLMLDMHKLAM